MLFALSSVKFDCMIVLDVYTYSFLLIMTTPATERNWALRKSNLHPTAIAYFQVGDDEGLYEEVRKVAGGQ